jgi:hypothetical protein
MEKTKYQLALEKVAAKAAEIGSKALKFCTEISTAETFESVKIKDSDSLIEYAELVEGSAVSISTSTGSEPAPDKEYSLVNGAVILVKAGVIESVVKPADEAVEDEAKDISLEELADEVVAETETEKVADTKLEDVKTLEDKVAKLEEMVAAMMEVIDLQPSKEEVSEFNKKVEALSKVPTQLSADNRVEMKESELEKAKRLAEKFTKK